MAPYEFGTKIGRQNLSEGPLQLLRIDGMSIKKISTLLSYLRSSVWDFANSYQTSGVSFRDTVYHVAHNDRLSLTPLFFFPICFGSRRRYQIVYSMPL